MSGVWGTHPSVKGQLWQVVEEGKVGGGGVGYKEGGCWGCGQGASFCSTLRASLSGTFVGCRKPVLGVCSFSTLWASLSGTFLQTLARTGYATDEALFISAQLSTDAVSALRKVWVLITLRAPLSGTFLQTLPDLVTPLKGHSLSPRSCPPTRSASSQRFGY